LTLFSALVQTDEAVSADSGAIKTLKELSLQASGHGFHKNVDNFVDNCLPISRKPATEPALSQLPETRATFF
jgi:hypothetical protein